MLKLSQLEQPYKHFECLDLSTNNRLRVVPERGGLITEWRCNGKDVLYFDAERFKDTEQSIRGGIPILFPVCGPFDGVFFDSTKPKLVMPQHGFARNLSWKIAAIKDYPGICLTLNYSKKTLSYYPYLFKIIIEIVLQENNIHFNIDVHNMGKEVMPFSFGFHPYFNIVNLSKVKIEGLSSFCIDHKTSLQSNTSKQLSLLSQGIDLLSGPSNTVIVSDMISGANIQLHHHAPMDLTVLWTDPPRSMVCVEPWTSPRGSLSSGARTLLVNPQSIQSLSYALTAN